jgi:hypothetical protein
MKMTTIIKKLNFYSEWYSSMSRSDQQETIGKWVFERIKIFAEVLIEMEKAVPQRTLPIGNYTSQF